jgi:hypothetical protein
LISALRNKFYLCSDPKIAQKFGIDTTKPGDVYLLRQTGTKYSSEIKPNALICDYPYQSTLFMKGDELENRVSARNKI